MVFANEPMWRMEDDRARTMTIHGEILIPSSRDFMGEYASATYQCSQDEWRNCRSGDWGEPLTTKALRLIRVQIFRNLKVPPGKLLVYDEEEIPILEIVEPCLTDWIHG